MILRDFDLMILRFYAYVFNLCLIYNFSFFQRSEVSMYICIAIFIADGYFISCKSTINKE